MGKAARDGVKAEALATVNRLLKDIFNSFDPLKNGEIRMYRRMSKAEANAIKAKMGLSFRPPPHGKPTDHIDLSTSVKHTRIFDNLDNDNRANDVVIKFLINLKIFLDYFNMRTTVHAFIIRNIGILETMLIN